MDPFTLIVSAIIGGAMCPAIDAIAAALEARYDIDCCEAKAWATLLVRAHVAARASGERCS